MATSAAHVFLFGVHWWRVALLWLLCGLCLLNYLQEPAQRSRLAALLGRVQSRGTTPNRTGSNQPDSSFRRGGRPGPVSATAQRLPGGYSGLRRGVGQDDYVSNSRAATSAQALRATAHLRKENRSHDNDFSAAHENGGTGAVEHGEDDGLGVDGGASTSTRSGPRRLFATPRSNPRQEALDELSVGVAKSRLAAALKEIRVRTVEVGARLGSIHRSLVEATGVSAPSVPDAQGDECVTHKPCHVCARITRYLRGMKRSFRLLKGIGSRDHSLCHLRCWWSVVRSAASRSCKTWFM